MKFMSCCCRVHATKGSEQYSSRRDVQLAEQPVAQPVVKGILPHSARSCTVCSAAGRTQILGFSLLFEALLEAFKSDWRLLMKIFRERFGKCVGRI
jgi:hypothetical protein